MKGCRNPSPPFTTLHSSGNRTSVHHLLLSPSTGFRFFVAHHFSAKLFGYTICLPRKNSQVKGGEGLRQPFTHLTLYYRDTYTQKVKGEGFSQIFFYTDNLRPLTTVTTAVFSVRSFLMYIRNFLMYVRSLRTNSRSLRTKIAQLL